MALVMKCIDSGKYRPFAISVVSLWAVVFTVQTKAVDVVASIQNTSEYTSNTLREENNEIGEWIHQPGIDVGLKHDGSSWLMDAAYSTQQRLYQKDFWDDETVTTGQGSVNFMALPQRLSFYFRNNRVESSIRALQAQTQDNRQLVSTNEVGTSLNFQPRGKKDFVQLTYAYVDTHANVTQTDNVRQSGSLTYLFGASPLSRFELSGNYSDIDYDGLIPAAIYKTANLGYIRTTPTLEMTLRAGHVWFNQAGRPSMSNGSYNVGVLWRASAAANLKFDGSYGVVDQSSQLNGNLTQVHENSDSNAAFTETRADISYTYQFSRLTTMTAVSWARQDYPVDVPLDDVKTALSLVLSYQLTKQTSIRLSADISDREFKDQGDKQKESSVDLRFNHQLGQSFKVDWGGSYLERESDATFGYREWVFSVKLLYTFTSAKAGRS